MTTRIIIESSFLSEIPPKPGLYRLYDTNNELLYIGASSNLQNRIKQHFSHNSTKERKRGVIRQYTSYLEFESYDSVERAFEEERIEIWTKQPPYNKRGITDLSYSFIIFRKKGQIKTLCLSNREADKLDQDDEFFRMNMSKKYVLDALNSIRKYYPFCFPSSTTKCWDHLIGLCYGSCMQDDLDQSTYWKNSLNLMDAISGKNNALVNEIHDELTSLIIKMEFEKAQKISNALESLKTLRLKYGGQGVIRDLDIFEFKKKNDIWVVKIHFLRKTSLIKEELMVIKGTERDEAESYTFLKFLLKFYRFTGFPPIKIKIKNYFPSPYYHILKNWFQHYFGVPIIII